MVLTYELTGRQKKKRWIAVSSQRTSRNYEIIFWEVITYEGKRKSSHLTTTDHRETLVSKR